jgi:DNA topoisomerase-1
LGQVTVADAMKYLSLPRKLGDHPETGKTITASIGRFGPYIVHDGDFRSIPKGVDMFQVDLKQALELLSAPKKGRGASKTPVKSFGPHPVTGEEIQIFNGPYGPYFKVGKVNASLPENTEVEKATLEMAIEALKDRIKAPKAKKDTTKKSSAVKKTAKPKAEATEKTEVKKAASAEKKVIIRKKK